MPILDLLDPLKIDSDIDDSPEVSLPKINAIKTGPKPLIVCGTMHAFYNYKNIIELAKHWSAPIFADPTSQVKFSSSSSLIIGNYDLMLRNVSVDPSRIIRFGNKPTSKSLNNLLNKFKDRVVTVGKYKQFNDDTDIYIQSSNRKFCLAQISGTDKNSNKFWLESITKNSRKTKAILDKHRNHNVTEPLIYSDIVNILCKGDSLFIGNSMPIRDMDSYTAPSNTNIKVLSNRGASGIDGLIASACGMSVESNQKNVLVLGDVSFAHDIGSLVDASRLNIDLTIVIVNNRGGNIFNQLPIEEHVKKSYKKFWLTNPNLDTESICKAFKYNYIKTDNITDFKEKFSHTLSLKGLKVVEVLCEVKNDNRFRKNVLKELSSF
jgi:2-succinyl-5-enolpyruvyl-6-hydroxy-3-cyclohexene-1-carboxylate synthase